MISRRHPRGYRNCLLAIVDPFLHYAILEMSTKAGQLHSEFIEAFEELLEEFTEMGEFG